jgi:hypothetical protein
MTILAADESEYVVRAAQPARRDRRLGVAAPRYRGDAMWATRAYYFGCATRLPAKGIAACHLGGGHAVLPRDHDILTG